MTLFISLFIIYFKNNLRYFITNMRWVLVLVKILMIGIPKKKKKKKLNLNKIKYKKKKNILKKIL